MTTECFIVTPVHGPLEVFDAKETSEGLGKDPELSQKCQKTTRYFLEFLSCDAAIVQASGIFVSEDKNLHHIITDPLLVRIRKPNLDSGLGSLKFSRPD